MPDSGSSSDNIKPGRFAGDMVFAAVFLALALILLSQISTQTAWLKGVKLFAQPRFWPAVSLIGMTGFALCYFLGSVFSRWRGQNHFQEVALWLRSFEYALWFMAYVWTVPKVGYLASTLIFVALLTLRTGYRSTSTFVYGAIVGIIIVVVFKGFLSVKIPGGYLYEFLPDAMRNFMSLYL